ncbi:MAG: glycosyltransferase [Lysobacter sp.]
MATRRVLLVSDEMEIGGSQRQITHLLAGLDRDQWEPELLFFRTPSFLIQDIERLGVRVHHIPKHGRIDAGFVLRYAALLRQGNYVLVHAFSLTAELWTLVARSLPGHSPPQVASVRGLYLTESARFWQLKRLVIRHSAAVIANARACAEVAANRTGIPLERFAVIANGVAAPALLCEPERRRLRKRLDIPPQRTFGLFVGRLVTDKNLHCLLRAMARLPAELRPVVVLAGDGPLHDELQAMAENLGLAADLRFLGERRDACQLMQIADFLVLPSRQEGMSNAVLEAMVAGCPVVASQVGGNQELVVSGRTGLLFPNDDDHALGSCLGEISQNAALRQRLSTQARQQALERYSIAGMVHATTAVYERVLRDPIPLRRAIATRQTSPMDEHA